MNEEAIKIAYDLFVADGYKKSIDEFKSLMQGNPKGREVAYNLFVADGYKKPINEFEVLMGVTAPSDLTTEEASLEKKKSGTSTSLDSTFVSNEYQPTEQDYFEGTFGDILRGFDAIIPLGLGDFVDDTARAVASGYNQGVMSENAADLLVRGNMSSDEDLKSFIEANKNAQQLGPSDEMMDYQKTYEENGKGFLGVVLGIAKNPSVISELIVSSMVGMASNTDALLAGGSVVGAGAGYGAATGSLAMGVGAAPGAVAGALASIPYAFATAGTMVEMGATFAELLQEEIGDEELTAENIKKVLNDEKKYSSIRNKAVARGITIGSIDALTGKMGGKLASSIVTKGGTQAASAASKKLVAKSVLAASGVEGVGGSIGEATARGVIGQDMDISEIALEGIAEMPGGVKDFISTRYSVPKYKVNGEKVNAEILDNLIETMTLEELQGSKIQIDNDYDGRKGKLQDRIVELSTEQQILEASPEVNKPTLTELTRLQIALNKLEGNKTEVGKAKAADLREQIKNLQENQLEEEVVAEVEEAVVSGVPEFNAQEEFDLLEDEEKASYLEAADGDQEVAIQSFADDVASLEQDLESESRFSLTEEGEGLLQADEQDVDAIAEEMNSLDADEVNFVAPEGETVVVSPIEESNSLETLTDEDVRELGFESTDEMVQPLESFEGIPMITGISDIAAGGTISDATGQPMNAKGGVMFNALAKVKAAWAGVERSKSETQYKKALDLYSKNKSLFERLWKEGRIPNGHVPMAIVRMSDDAVNSNEIVFRYLAPEVKAQPESNQKAALNDVVSNLQKKKAPQNKSLLDFIARENISTLGQLLDAIVKDANLRAKGDVKGTLTLDQRAAMFSELSTAPGVKTPNKAYLKSLYEGAPKNNSSLFTADNIYNAIGEPSMMKTKKGDIVSIVGVDVINGGVIDIDHQNYGTGPKGRLIALVKNPTNGINVFPTWRAKASRVFKPQGKKGKRPSQLQVSGQTMGTAASDLAFQGDRPTTKMTDFKILLGKLKFAFPDVAVATTIEEFNEVLQQPGVRTKVSEGKVILGMTKDGKIFLNPERESLATPIHEYGHIWIDYLRSKASDKKGTALLERGLKLVENTQALKDAIAKYGDTKLAREEALVELMATKGSTIIEAAKKSQFKEWMNATFKYIKEKFTTSEDTFKVNEIKAIEKDFKDGLINEKERDRRIKNIENSVSKSIKNMSLNEFINIGLADLFQGKAVSKSFDAAKESKGMMPRFELGDDVAAFIKQARGQGISEAAIKTALRRRGVDADVIASAIEKTKGNAAVRTKVSEEFAQGYDRVMKEIDGIIEKSKKRGRTYAQIPKNVIAYLEGTKLYENATDVQRETMIRDIRKKFGIKEKSAPSVGRILGTIKDVINITISEKELLINRLKALNEGAKNVITAMSKASKLLNEEINDLVKSGQISTQQMANVLSRFSKVNLLSDVSIERFVDYMSKVFANAEYAEIISQANQKRKVAKANAATKIGIAQALSPQLQRLFSINPTLIPDAVLDKYVSLVEMFGKRERVLTLPSIEEVTQLTEDVMTAINEEQSLVPELQERYNDYDKVMNDEGKVDYAATIKSMLKDEVITDKEYELMKKYKSSIVPKKEAAPMSEAEIEERRQDIINEVTQTELEFRELPSREERDLATKLKRLIRSGAIDGLSLRDLQNLSKVIDNINNGYLPHFAEVMVEKLNAVNDGKNLASAINRSKPLPLSRIYAKLKSLVTRKDSIVEMIRRNPLFNIDQVFGDFKTKDIFESVFGAAARAVAKFTNEYSVIQNKIEKAQNAVQKSLGRDSLEYTMSKYKQMAYLIQQEFLSNPQSPQVNSVIGFLKATIKRIDDGTTQLSERDAEMLQSILKDFTDADGNFDNDALFDSFNNAEKESIKTIQEINSGLGSKADFTSSVIRGDKFNPLNNYVHLNVMHETQPSDMMNGPSFVEAFNNSLRPSTRAKTLIERTGKVSALNFDVYASVLKGSKQTLMDFHLTEPIRTARRTMNQAEKDLQSNGERMSSGKRKTFNAIKSAFEETVENLITNSYAENTVLDQALEFLKKTGYRTILAGSGRFVAELTSNVSFALLVDPVGFTNGTKIVRKISNDQGPSILNNLNSGQTTRMYSDGLSGRMVDTNILSQATGTKTRGASTKAANFLRKYWDKTGQRYVKGVEFVADAMISTPDKMVMRPIWFGTFDSKFKEITGKSPDFDKIAANDEAYMSEYKEALNASTKHADNRSVLAGATDNAFMGILKGTSKPNQSAILKGFNAFNGFMTRFLIFEYVTARTGIMNMIGKGDLNKRQGAALIAGVTSRMVLYTLIGQYLSHALTDLFDDEPEYDENFQKIENPNEMKSFDKALGQAFTSTFTSLLFGRDFGNATKSILNAGIEDFNKEHLDFLREGEYDAYKDAIQYTVTPKSKDGGGSGLADYLMKMGAAYGPILKTTDLVIKKITEPAKKKADAIKRSDDELYYRVPMEILGNLGFIPLYKDVRKIVLAQIYGDLKKAQSDLNNAKKTKEEMLQGFDSETDMKRYNYELWENTYGPNSPDYDVREAQKKLKAAERKLKQQMKDELYDYTPSAKEGSWETEDWGGTSEDNFKDNGWDDQW